MMLQKVGARAVVLHSILKQKQRFSSLEQFKSHKARILVATDVASRGLDLPNVAIVVNHNVPGAPRNYVHRVGRTARAGRKGLSITMVSPYDTGTKMVISIVKPFKSEIRDKIYLDTPNSNLDSNGFTQVIARVVTRFGTKNNVPKSCYRPSNTSSES